MLSIFKHEVMYYFKNKKELIEIYVFIFSLCLMVPFGLPAAEIKTSSIALAVLWMAMVAGTALAASTLFARDQESGRLELYQLLPAGLERIILAKWAAFWLLMVVPLWLLVPVWGEMLGLPQPRWLQLAVGLGFGSAAVSVLYSFVAGLSGGHGRGAALLTLLAVPLSIPIIIFGTSYCRGSHLWSHELLFLGGFVLFMLPLMCLAVASSIRASN